MSKRVSVPKSRQGIPINESRLKEDFTVIFEDFSHYIVEAKNDEEVSTLVSRYNGLIDISE